MFYYFIRMKIKKTKLCIICDFVYEVFFYLQFSTRNSFAKRARKLLPSLGKEKKLIKNKPLAVNNALPNEHNAKAPQQKLH